MSEQLPKILPITILITSFNRINLLKKTIQLINERTFFPYRIIVVDNHSVDGSVRYLKECKVQGKIFDHLFLPENIGQSKALNQAFRLVEKWENELRRPSNDFIISTNEDIYPPMLGQKNCWLTQMVDILQRYEPEYGGICGRIQRTPRNDMEEDKEITMCRKGFPSVYRLMRRSDLRKLGDRPFGRLKKWDSNSMGEKYNIEVRKKFGFTNHLYFDHAGFMLEKKGYGKDVDTFTVAENKLDERKDKPYPDIDPLTNVPIQINHSCDEREHAKRQEYNNRMAGKIKDAETTIIVLTYKRINGLKRIIDSIKAKTTDTPYKLLVVIDNDDTEAYNWCMEQDINCVLLSYNGEFVNNANLGVYLCKTPYFVILSDDSEIIDDDWLSKSLKIFKEKFSDGIGLMSYNENIQKGRIFTLGMSSKRFIHKIGGNMYFPLYKHYKGDRELTELAKKLNCYHYEDSIHVKHYHWQTDENTEKDETYKISEQFLKHDRDLKNYRNENVDILINKNYHDYFSK